MKAPRLDGVSVTVPARLHLGFLDLEGGLGRRFGGLGITLEGPYTRLDLAPADELSVEGPDAQRARGYLEQLLDHFDLERGVGLRVEEAIAAHSGLGSGTQLALATGMAVSQLYGIGAEPRVIAQLLDRGARSGIGLGAFVEGGVLLDGGRGESDGPPPIISRLAFPGQWRVLLIYDRKHDGVHGKDEIEAFQTLSTFPPETAAHLCRLAVMAALPALAEGDLHGFGAAVSEIQRTVGDYFAPAQGGRFASSAVSEVLEWLESEGVSGLGQSSWGPTGFALVDSEARGQRFLEAARKRWGAGAGLAFELRAGRNTGASATIQDSVRPAP